MCMKGTLPAGRYFVYFRMVGNTIKIFGMGLEHHLWVVGFSSPAARSDVESPFLRKTGILAYSNSFINIHFQKSHDSQSNGPSSPETLDSVVT